MCGGEFTDEHHFSKYCKNCKAKMEFTVKMQADKETQDKAKSWKTFDLSENFIEYRYKEISLGITCPECGYQVDASSKLQPWEIKCDKCKLLFTIDTVVRVTRYA